MSTLYPYPTLVGRIDVGIRRVSIDGKPLHLSLISRTERVVALNRVERDDWEEGTLEIEATLPNEELADGPWASVTCVAILAEGSTNTRIVTQLERARGERIWRGTVRVRRSAHIAQAILRISVVGSYGGVDGRIIGTCDEPWIIDILSGTPSRQWEPEIRKEDFRDGDHEWLRPFKEVPWLVETVGDRPTVLLNTAFEGLAELLEGARSPLEKAAAALVAGQIAAEAWTAMFHSALGEVEADEDGRPQIPSGWHGPVLRAMLPDVFPGLSVADALVEVHSTIQEGQGWADLQPRIQFAAARRAQIAKNMTTAVRTFARGQEGADR